jgi:hypothetical protein
MQIKEIITESLSRVVFHYTNNKTALAILQSGEFQLSGSIGSVEQQYAPKGYPYFLSTTRTRHGGYHRMIGEQAALFVLDGNWFNNHYISKPIDYWENRNPTLGHHRDSEAEDRVFSKEPTIPIGGVTAVHLYCDVKAADPVKAWTRQALIAAKRQGIPAYFYTDKAAWKNFDTRKQGDVSTLTGQEGPGGWMSRHKGYLLPWMELIQAKERSQLSKKAESLRYSLQYGYNKDDAVYGLKTDLSNARKPNSGADRKNAIKMIQFMQQNGLKTVKEFVDALAEKWKDPKGVTEDEAGMFSKVMTHETSPVAAKLIQQQGFKRSRTGIFFNVEGQNYSGGGYGGAVVMAKVSGPIDDILNLEDDNDLPDELDDFADGEEIADYARSEGYWAWTDGVQFAVLDPRHIQVIQPVSEATLPKNQWQLIISNADKHELGSELVDLVHRAYSMTPQGSFINSLRDVIPSDWNVIDWDHEPDVDATVFYRHARPGENWEGIKIQGIGHDGTRTSKDKAIAKVQEMLSKPGTWLESSDAMRRVLLKLSVPAVKNERVLQHLFNDPKLKMVSDDTYVRTLQAGKKITETVFGHPNLS